MNMKNGNMFAILYGIHIQSQTGGSEEMQFKDSPA